MSQRSRFFDSVAGDRTYDTAAFAQVISGLMDTGVLPVGNQLGVTENSPAAMTVLVGIGKAFILGYFHEVYSAAEVVTIATAHATLPRIDRVVIRRSLANREATLAVIAGTAATTPSPPALTQSTTGTYEISLAQVSVTAAAASIVNANITDERAYSSRVTFAQPALGLSTAAAAGSSGNAIRTDATIAVFDATVPTSLAIGAAAATGSAARAARRDHAHGVTTAALVVPQVYDTPSTAAGGKKIFVGSATPTGASEGDVWIKG